MTAPDSPSPQAVPPSEPPFVGPGESALSQADLRMAGMFIAALVVRLGGVVLLQPHELEQAVDIKVIPRMTPGGAVALESIFEKPTAPPPPSASIILPP